MRRLSIAFFAFAVVAALAGIGFNVWVQGMACAFAAPSGSCRYRWPWQMGSEDAMLLVAAPLAPALILALIGWALARH